MKGTFQEREQKSNQGTKKQTNIESERIGLQLSELDPQGYHVVVHTLDVYSYTQSAALMYVNVM